MFDRYSEFQDNSFLPDWAMSLLQIILIIFIVLLIFRIARGWLPRYAYGSWTHVIDNISNSSQDFYKRFENKLHDAEIKGIVYDWKDFYEGPHFISGKRRYRKIEWKDKLFYICVAPFGSGFFISWWHFEKTPLWERFLYMFPGGRYIVNAINPMTFYRIDTARAFQRYMQDAVMDSIQEIAKEKNQTLRPMEEPKSYDFHNRK